MFNRSEDVALEATPETVYRKVWYSAGTSVLQPVLGNTNI